MNLPNRLSLARGLFYVVVFTLLAGCGGGKTKTDDPDALVMPPRYAILPDNAPLRDQIDEASAYVDRELLEEQEKFALKRADEIRRLYSSAEGNLLVPESSFAWVESMMRSPLDLRLSISCDNFELKAPSSAYRDGKTNFEGRVYLLGDSVPAYGEYTDEVSTHGIAVRARYRYMIDAGASAGPTQIFDILRFMVYSKTPLGTWRRVRIEERPVVSSPGMSTPGS